MEEYKNRLRQEIEDLSQKERLSADYRKKKLIIWFVRTILSVILYILFWKYEWVRWTLVLYIPLSLFNLVMLLQYNKMLDKKLDKIRSQINQ